MRNLCMSHLRGLQHMIASKILIFTNYYRYNAFYEDTLKKLLSRGFVILLLDNSNKSLSKELTLKHKNLLFCDGPPNSYDGGMVFLHSKKILEIFQRKYLLHLDNDCFLNGTDELEFWLSHLIENDYDFCSHIVQESVSKQYSYNNYGVSLIENGSIIPPKGDDIPTPCPHFETSYSFFKTTTWQDLSDNEVSHGRKLICALYRMNKKIGAHQANYIWNYSSWGKEWFHIGDIMRFHWQFESNDAFTYKPNSEFNLYRTGFFMKHLDFYPNKFNKIIQNRILSLVEHMGGRQKVQECWDKISKGSCLENWRPL